jgi:hypothetical protein
MNHPPFHFPKPHYSIHLKETILDIHGLIKAGFQLGWSPQNSFNWGESLLLRQPRLLKRIFSQNQFAVSLKWSENQ